MANLIQFLPELEGEEQVFLQSLIKEMDDKTAQQFANVYRARRRDPLIILITSLLGFIGLAGVQRFLVDQIGMGLLYLFTGGLCFIGTIIDVVTYKRLAFEYNQIQAQQVSLLIKDYK